MTDYDDFSALYDSFTDDVDYEGRTKKILELFNQYDRKPTLILDLACGTGGFSFPFAKAGVEVIGVDRSEGMLSKATAKKHAGSENPIFLMQSAEELELYGTVDGAICMLDSLNHITDYESFCTAIGRVSLFLEKDRLFIFDLNTPYKHKEILGDNCFVKENENAFCVWQNNYREKGIVDIYLDFFAEDNDGKYLRFSEDFSERAYTEEEVLVALQKNSLEPVAVMDDLSGNPPTEKSERITYIVRKK